MEKKRITRKKKPSSKVVPVRHNEAEQDVLDFLIFKSRNSKSGGAIKWAELKCAEDLGYVPYKWR